ncbi:MAG: hypothetical protein H7X95_08020 [Deltaproteobacteria bacterium]|nr:hypothetical protein [Deltaproteobacteria bacterium]
MTASRYKRLLGDWLASLSPVGSVLLMVAAAMFVWQCLTLGEVLIDDAFITFSFSKNLALGNGPVYSHGLRAEGYSNFLWMVLVALPLTIARQMDPLLSARLMCGPFVLLLGWGTYRLAAIGTNSRIVGALAVLLLSFSTDFATAYLSGLETLPYTAMFVTSFALLLSSWRKDDPFLRRARALVPWCALGAALMRIDGFMVLGLVFGFDLAHSLIVRRKFQPVALLKWAGPALLAYAVWFGWRWWYYGLPLPSTYYAKALIPTLLPDRGFNYVKDELTSSALFAAAFAATWLLARARGWAVPLVVAAAAQLLYVMKVGGDWMPFGRFVMPAVPLLTVLLIGGMVEAVRTIPVPLRKARIAATVALVGVGVVLAGRIDHRWWNDGVENQKIAFISEQIDHVNRLKRAASFLRAAVPVGRRLVTDYAGVMGYYTDAAVIDMWGLATPVIARRGGVERIQPIYGRTCPECYPELDPEFFHVWSPLVRPEPAFKSVQEVIANVWQTDTIGRYIDFAKVFAVGRIVDRSRGDALYFLEKRGPAFSSALRNVDGFQVDYPFEPPHPNPN